MVIVMVVGLVMCYYMYGDINGGTCVFAGSTDAAVFSLQGNNDPVTAALHIILGQYVQYACLRVRLWGGLATP